MADISAAAIRGSSFPKQFCPASLSWHVFFFFFFFFGDCFFFFLFFSKYTYAFFSFFPTVRRNLTAAYHAMLTLPEDIVRPEWLGQIGQVESPIMRAVVEHLHYRMLYDANISFNEWSEWYLKRPVETYVS